MPTLVVKNLPEALHERLKAQASQHRRSRLASMPLADAQGELARGAADLRDGLIEVGHSTARTLAMKFGISAYDARYLAVAQALKTRLVTEDITLRKKVPDLTCSVLEAMAT